jgi:pyrroline-5-carboxylate reductase
LAIGFLGTGRMAGALAGGWLRAGWITPGTLWGSDPVEAARTEFGRVTGATVFGRNTAVLEKADVIVLAVKPAQVEAVLTECRSAWSSRHLLVSIAAGVRLGRLESLLPEGARVVRVMPNTPALVGESASAYAAGRHATDADARLTGRLLEVVGKAWSVKEDWLDAVTGLSGSGPAYGFLMIEALADGGVAEGLPRDIAQHLAAQTLLGAARMVLETGQHPGWLKDSVCSPGGTTIEGILALESGGVRAGLIRAVRAATRRSRELG